MKAARKTTTTSRYSASHPDQRAAQLRSTEAHEARILAVHPEQDLSPQSIRALQDRLEDQCRAIEREQAQLRAEAAFFDEGEDISLWDSLNQL
jgi:hypothetical protein